MRVKKSQRVAGGGQPRSTALQARRDQAFEFGHAARLARKLPSVGASGPFVRQRTGPVKTKVVALGFLQSVEGQDENVGFEGLEIRDGACSFPACQHQRTAVVGFRQDAHEFDAVHAGHLQVGQDDVEADTPDDLRHGLRAVRHGVTSKKPRPAS